MKPEIITATRLVGSTAGLRASPESVSAATELGRELLLAGDPQGAVDVLTRAMLLGAEPVEGLQLLARAHELRGDPYEAESLLRRAVTLEPENLAVRSELARILGVLGDRAACVDAWRWVHARAPSSATIDSALGIALSNAGYHAEALLLLERVTEEEPENAEALSDLGRAHLAAGAPERALPYLERAIVIAPASAEAHVNLGATLQRMKFLDRAVECYHRAASLAPKWHIPYFDLGVAIHERGDWFTARLHMLRAAALAPQDPDVRAALAGIVPPGISEALLPPSKSPEEYAFSGLLVTFGVPGLLELLKNHRSTGTLIVARPGSGAVLWVVDGDLVGGGAPGVPRVGELLVRSGALTAQTLERALATRAPSPSEPLGAFLLARKLVTLDALKRACALQLGAVLTTILEWREGHFHFAEGKVPVFEPELARQLTVDSRLAILEAARIVDERTRRP
jgi:Flp pilus assembly protein TadD